jgi:hypothetical protein
VCLDLACGTGLCAPPIATAGYRSAGFHTDPFANRMSESAESGLHFSVGYGHVGWANRASGDGSGLGGRVGFHHKTLESFLGAILNAGLTIRALQEFSGGGVILPRNIGLIAEK